MCLSVLKMNSVIFLVVVSFLSLVSAQKSDDTSTSSAYVYKGIFDWTDIYLKAETKEAVGGKPYTLICSVKPSLKTYNIVWKRKGTAVFVSGPFGFTRIIDVNQTEIGNVFGRFYVTMHGPHTHHLTLLTDKQKDDGSSWRCLAEGHESNMVTIHAVDPEPPSSCGIRCIFGVATGVTVGVLFFDLLIFTRCLKRL